MLIKADAITIKLGEETCFENTTWVIGAGEHWAVMGPTGSGKSLLARALCRQVMLCHGEIRYFFDASDGMEGRTFPHPGEILTFSAETHREFLRRYSDYIQERWQSFEGDGVPTVRNYLMVDEVTLPGRPVISHRTQRLHKARLVETLRLEELLGRSLHQLSNGESRKVFLASLLLCAPRLLILDAPYIGLDADTRGRLADTIEAALEDNRQQILFLTSREEELPKGVSNILVVDRCHVARSGEPRALMTGSGKILSQSVEKVESLSVNSLLDQIAIRYNAWQIFEMKENESPLVRMQGVSVSYYGVHVLKNIDWQVNRGERWALLGPNGAGKTTLLSLILGDNPQAYANQVYLFGRRRGTGESIWEIKRNIGWISPELHVHYPKTISCLEVVCSGFFDSVGLFQRCSAEQVGTAANWLVALGLESYLNKQLATLSTGQQRLVLFARAMVKNPPLLILDEPLQGLDAAYRKMILNLIDRLCVQSSLSLIYVSHYKDEIPSAVTRQLFLVKGEGKSSSVP